MLKAATAKELQEIDRVTIERYGISGAILMERAGLAVVSRTNDLFPDEKIIVLCGGGNNGGDGFVAARILHNQGRSVEVFLTARPEALKGDAKATYDAAVKFGVKIFSLDKFLTLNSNLSTPNSMIVDALLGAGLNKNVRHPLSEVIEKVNKLSAPVMSIDIPSGISSDNGQIMGCAIKAKYTVSFGLPRMGHLLYPGAEYTGKLFIEDIGFPRKLLKSQKIAVNLLQKEDMTSMLPQRPKYSHKGTYGHVLLLAGSRGKTGAALMAAKACLRSGAGLVTIGIPETLVNAFQSRVTEEMILPLPDKGNGTLSYKSIAAILELLKKRFDVLAIGPGLSPDDEIPDLVIRLVTESDVPAVIDADGLNAMAGKTRILKRCRAPVILTPHVGEMARLLSQRSAVSGQQSELKKNEKRKTKNEIDNLKLKAHIEQDRINTAISFSKRTRTYLVLKGAPTVIAAPEGNAFINSTGNPGMATAGSGDVLTGMISAFLAQKLSPLNASILGVYMHGLAGDLAAEKKGMHSLTASDIIKEIPKAFKSIQEISRLR
ncbi:MAG: NAD(P)H-hydrate dehydratase [Nitrospirae bacterium]|nr:NAD(P)H-hydrate dehydratase [Nitrospirota bacterium]